MSRNKTDFSEHKALEILLGDVLSQVDNVSSLQKLTQIFLEILMKKERELFLSTQQDNKANGYYSRDLACMFGNLNLKVPRDRLSFFRPLVLPSPYQKADESFNNFVLNLILHNYSPN
ncbi:MAG: transposase, partial [Brevinematales bacterium]